MPSSLDEALAELVASLTPSRVGALASALEDGELTLDSSAVGVDAIRGVGPDAARCVSMVFRAIPPNVGADAIALALRTANALRIRDQLGHPGIEIVWTGPQATGTLMRPTGAVIEEMLRKARASGEILVVGYSLTAADGTLMRGVIELLAAASRRGAAVIFVLHRDDEERNKANLIDAWSVFVRKPTVLTWRPGPEHPYTKLHAKALVVDRRDLLVTSANLTFHGLESNLELGLRLRGPQAAVVAERFDQLRADGVLHEWND
jgi:hypothetical protein